MAGGTQDASGVILKPMDFGLKDRAALVAAASRGLGRAVAMGLAREGASLALCARTAGPLEETAAEIRAATGVRVLTKALDVTRAGATAEFVHEAHRTFGRLDICVANAGGPPSKAFASTSEDEWQSAVELNLLSTVRLAHETLPLMQQQRWGRFLAITSVAVKQPLTGLVLSNAVRSAVVGLVKTLANEYGPHGITVNNLCPGYTATHRLTELAASIARNEGITLDQVVARWTSQIPAGRLGDPAEFADAAVFLASERAAYITGQSIVIDGGFARGL